MWYEMVEKLLRQLMTLLRVDTSYFASRVPVVKDIATILLAVGWALLIGNLAYQALRSMASGVGIEAEEPGRLVLRTAIPKPLRSLPVAMAARSVGTLKTKSRQILLTGFFCAALRLWWGRNL